MNSSFAILHTFGAVPKRPKGAVCKTSIRGFKSHPRLHHSQLVSSISTANLSGAVGKIVTCGRRNRIFDGVFRARHLAADTTRQVESSCSVPSTRHKKRMARVHKSFLFGTQRPRF